MGAGQIQIARELDLVEGQDAFVGEFEGRFEAAVAVVPGGLDLLDRDAQGIGTHPIEALAEVEQGPIPFAAHLGQNGVHGLDGRFRLAAIGAIGNLVQSPGRRGQITQHLQLQGGGPRGAAAWMLGGAGGHGAGRIERHFKLSPSLLGSG